MSISRLWAILAVALPVLAALLAPMSTVDLAYQVRAGNAILASGLVPLTDTWTSTVQGQPWFDQQWGAQVLLALVHNGGGWAALALLRALLVGAIFGILYGTLRRQRVAERSAALLSLLAFALVSPALALRPQVLGILLFVLVLVALEARDRRPWIVWVVPLLAAAWANVHGSFVLAPLLVAWAALEDGAVRGGGWRRMLVLLAVTCLATAITPSGPGVWGYALDLAANAELARRVTEWQPPALTDPVGLAFFVSGLSVALVVLARWRAGRRLAWPSGALLGALFILGIRAVRGLAWWPIGAAVAIAPLVASPPVVAERPEPRELPRMQRLNLLVAGLLGIGIVVLLPWWRPSDPVTGPSGILRDAPGGLTAAVRASARPAAVLFNPQRWGSWLEWAVPATRTFVDSRIELFPAAVWADYESITSGAPGWQGRLAARGVDLVIVDGADSGSATGKAFAERLRAEGWREVYAGIDGWLFASPGGAASVPVAQRLPSAAAGSSAP